MSVGHAFLTSRSDVSAGRKTYMEARPTTSMKKGWLCRTSYDEKNHEIAPVMIASDDPDRVMIKIQ